MVDSSSNDLIRFGMEGNTENLHKNSKQQDDLGLC